MSTATRYAHVRTALDEACKAAGRAPESVLLLAVSKTVDVDEVQLALDAGARAFGENRPDELLRKKAAFPQVSFHFIGNIQSRRIHDIVSAADLIHSVCKQEHLAKIDHAAASIGKVQRILLEVNVSGEQSKSGFSPDEVCDIAKVALGFEHLALEGLMTMAPQGNPQAITATFTGLRDTLAKVNDALAEEHRPACLSELSMGMTEDWPVAVPLGATIVRVGRAIFSDSFEVA